MKIAIDLTYSPVGGALTQILHFVNIFNKIEGLDIVIYSKKSNDNILSDITKNNKIVYSRISNLTIFGRIFWGQLFLPFHLKKIKADILFCPGNHGPIFSSVKTIIWIGTIGPLLEEFVKYSYWTSKHHNKFKLYLNKFFMLNSSRTAKGIIFESEFTKDLFVKEFNIKKSNSYVINIGNDAYFSNKNSDDLTGLDPSLVSNSKYILCVSHLYPYKNIIQLLFAYKQTLDNNKTPAKLIIAGNKDFNKYIDEINKKIVELNLQHNVEMLGSVSKKNLKYLYSNAYLLVFPSPFENFAYTLVEAMSCGTPIVCSNTTAMPETCKNAALYFDPYNSNEMAKQMSLVIENEDLRKTMSEKSLARSKELPDYKEVAYEVIEIMRGIVND